MYVDTVICIDDSFSSYKAQEGLGASHLPAVLPAFSIGFKGSSKPKHQAQHSSQCGFSYLLVPLESSGHCITGHHIFQVLLSAGFQVALSG